MAYANHNDLQSRFSKITDLLSAGCDTDFDHDDELEREFQELRLQLNNFQ